MSENELLLSSLKRIEDLKEGLHTYAYNTGDWIEIAVDDYDFYKDDKDFANLSKEIHKEFMDKFNIKIVFVYCPYNDNAIKRIKDKKHELIKCV